MRANCSLSCFYNTKKWGWLSSIFGGINDLFMLAVLLAGDLSMDRWKKSFTTKYTRDTKVNTGNQAWVSLWSVVSKERSD